MIRVILLVLVLAAHKPLSLHAQETELHRALREQRWSDAKNILQNTFEQRSSPHNFIPPNELAYLAGYTTFAAAYRRGEIEGSEQSHNLAQREIVRYGPAPELLRHLVNTAGDYLQTPLHLAVAHQDTPFILTAMLCYAGSNHSALDIHKNTPLHLLFRDVWLGNTHDAALCKQVLKIFKLLAMPQGPDINRELLLRENSAQQTIFHFLLDDDATHVFNTIKDMKDSELAQYIEQLIMSRTYSTEQ